MNLKESINNLYEVFQSYTVLGNLRDRSCDCCVTDEEIKELLSKPLKEIQPDEIYHFMSSALTTYGDINDYKHFLPRILELTVDYDFLTDFHCYEKLNHANWKFWKENEVEAISSFLELLLIYHLNHLEYVDLIFVINPSIKYLGEEKTLNIWKQHLKENHLHFFVDYKLSFSDTIFLDFKQTTFDEWISSDFILKKLENLFLKTDDKIEANRISIAYTMLENER